MPRLCPDDHAVLQKRLVRGIELDACPECGGVFFDEGELPSLQAEGVAALIEVDQQIRPEGLVLIGVRQHRACPNCSRTMMEYRFQYRSQIGLDGCQNCGGIWVQEGELEEMAAYLREADRQNLSLGIGAEARDTDRRGGLSFLARLGAFFDRS